MIKNYIFLNQATRPLYIDIMNYFSNQGQKVVLITGDVRVGSVPLNSEIKVYQRFEYKNNTYLNRIVTFSLYSIYSFWKLHRYLSKKNELVITTTPPHLPFFGLYFKKLFRIKYHLIIYDIYPDVVISLGLIKRNGFIDKIWTWFNKKLYKNASSIITISGGMASTIQYYCTQETRIHVVSNWVDSNFISPMPKTENWFAQKYNQVDKLTVLYSGNLGATHDFDTLLEAIKILRPEKNIYFIIIGEGFKKQFIEEYQQKHELSNLLILPLQSKESLPYTLTCADIGVITLDDNASTVSVPSKTYYMMAAGSAIMALGAADSELSELIRKYTIGRNFSKGQFGDIVSYILEMKDNNDNLNMYRNNSRNASKLFSPDNAKMYYELIIS
jgi:glycosyltransferase involved in cell wall biosynthesis